MTDDRSLDTAFGPHLGALSGRRELLREAAGQYHFFLAEDQVPHKLQPGNVNYELTASLPGILDYLDGVHQHHFPDRSDAAPGQRLAQVFDLIAAHEERLAERLLRYLAARADVRVLGPIDAGRAVRAPTVSFTVDGRNASEIPPLLERHRVAVRYGDFYAYRAIDGLDQALAASA